MRRSARQPVRIDEVDIDFSALDGGAGGTSMTAADASAPGPTGGPTYLQQLLQSTESGDAAAAPAGGGVAESKPRVFDPALQGFVRKGRRTGAQRGFPFGGSSSITGGAAAAPAPATPPVAASAALAALLGSEVERDREDEAHAQEQAYAAYVAEKQAWLAARYRTGNAASGGGGGCASAAPSPSLQTSCTLVRDLFRDGVPDVEPWDLPLLSFPRYDTATCLRKEYQASASNSSPPGSSSPATQPLEWLEHPMLPETHRSMHFMGPEAAGAAQAKVPVKERIVKTKEELRAERRERMREKQQRQDVERARARKQQQQSRGTAAAVEMADGQLGLRVAGGPQHDRLTHANLRFNLFDASVLNPLAMENTIHSQYEQRFLEHQRRNHERHMAAIGNQLDKREKDRLRFALENPVLRVFLISPIFSPAHLSKLRRFANEGLLRGCVVWIRSTEAVVIVQGGEVAVRHLQRWILHKMKWEHRATTARLLFACDLHDAETFSFHQRPRAGGPEEEVKADDGGAGPPSPEREAVYMAFADTIAAAESLFAALPSRGPWRDLLHLWRVVLNDGAACVPL